MRVVDANVLVYSVDEDSPHHAAARSWMDEALSGSEGVVLPWLCLLAFLRVTTHPRLYDHPLSIDQAVDLVEDWLGAPPVRTNAPTGAGALAPRLRRALNDLGVGGNLVNDAYLAALATSCGAAIVSFDSDFSRFTDLVWVNPATAGR
ncbi:MAG: PIN domain-containing protein [Bifidobacteriaceae bacterium]|jgi:toxin-antitoxin system PIN domain toxin|nr:PIN domain-containing protein [Bifidobacteriaceae bacterium]